MGSNANLHTAKNEKNDEFYTRLEDIEKELSHYKAYFKGKTVFCNCDDPYESNFFKYFAMNFNFLGLKKLIATCYDSSPVAGEQLSLFPDKRPYKIEITEVTDENGDGATDLADVEYLLKNKHNTRAKLQSGDFRSEECTELLKKADIVVTNPPFSLFREYVAQLIEYKKQFVIIGNQNAITYKEIFPLLKENKMWLGNHSGAQSFLVPQNFERNNTYIENGKKYAKFGNICWFTNLDTKKRHEIMPLYKKYSPEEYPQYDNYAAIEVSKVSDIPYDYSGAMGVPITFLDKYNPEQFEIIGSNCTDNLSIRIIKEYTKLGYRFFKNDGVSPSGSGALRDKTSPKIEGKGKSDFSISPEGKILHGIYDRIFIRRKK